MKKEFEYSIVIGRFQPFHSAHQEILKSALAHAEKVIVIIGSHNRAPDPRNPFSSIERQEIILAAMDPEDKPRVEFLPIRDYLYNENAWFVEAQQKVSDLTDGSESICLVGHKSDVTSYYLDSFPTWKFVDYSPSHPIHATKIRDLYFKQDVAYTKYLHKNVVGWLEAFKKTPKFEMIKDNFDELEDYHEQWRGAPFPPTFTTVDAVVIKSAHLLVVRRRGRYGKGLIALPGGFLDPGETIRVSAIRELKEETGIKVDPRELFGAIKRERVFDDPARSLRGRTITHAYCLNLGAGALPKVKGDSDADKAWWMPLSEFYTSEDQFFEDHWHIVYHFVSNF